ncbi:PB1-F2 protein [Influenza A virus (A/Taiwan/0258/2008(H1N1))]|uniref:Protein PB1-F2 n=25 Tax=H1N1 subtype TaxID=114727 RepID=D5F1Q6_9INFA|nr:PB1-F2 protein [Influenza A virus (A/Denmark/151/2008(H1N1))]ACI25676.1 PB1-F2 protein [Influenza A virus (A/Denmark/21/2008(H1N1))]ACP20219.1 PB1-F2 protein [Influenza A virus (A/District of Columbia/WRAMC-1154047/2008(H1N1))]ACR15247.1 PB1-F2 protein [Influenza A virus (A/Taiwan/70013/2008(H1N1))]ACU80034.1 PB1-F2 protein [Influenza A virus (A/Boston/26/2008(H1N1))]ACU80177.1 PB1-F2 protein [Influenza A virus (A/Boston/12/2007(H1N1))]ACU80243.1 PB1-F2 protein [Influenza A virus (A/Boston
MGQEQDTPWIQSTGHTSTQKEEDGQKIPKLEHRNLTQLMVHYRKTMNQVAMPKQIVY